MAVSAHDLRGAASRYFQCEVLDEFYELAVRQLTVSNQPTGHWNSLFSLAVLDKLFL